MLNVQSIMTRPVFVCRPEDTLETAAKQMWDQDCGAVAVVDDNGCLAGMITDRDVCMAAYTSGRRLSDIAVRTAMSADAAVCRDSDVLDAVQAKMREKQIRRIPVVDGAGRPIGIVTLNDLARVAARAGSTKSQDMSGVAHTLAAICEPRRAAARAA
jgi:CBS domain-containing protein